MSKIYGYNNFENIKKIYASGKEINNYMIKGINGEQIVADALCEITEDIYIVCHPSLTNYEPDILVASSKGDFGFRIIEVKNWNIKYISKVQSNGTIYIGKNNKYINPKEQASKHVDDLRVFIQSNHKTLGVPTRPNIVIDKLVIFPEISKDQFDSNFTSGWTVKSKEEFYKRHLFKEDINNPKSLYNKMKNAKKEAVLNGININKLNLEKFIISIGTSSNYKLDEYDNEILNNSLNIAKQQNENIQREMKKKDEELENINYTVKQKNKKILELEEETRELRNNKDSMSYIKLKDIEREKEDVEKERTRLRDRATYLKKEKDMLIEKNKDSEDRIRDLSEEVNIMIKEKEEGEKEMKSLAKSIYGLTIVLVIFLGFFMYQNLNSKSPKENVENEKAVVSTNVTNNEKEILSKETINIASIKKEDYINKEVIVKATLSDFSFNKNLGTKFMKIKNDTGEIKGVAFKNTKLPYLKIGNTYTFVGKVDKYEGEFEIIVSRVE